MSDPASRTDRKRSPEYPSITLQEAIEKAAVLYEQDHGNSAARTVIAQHFRSTTKSSAFMQWVASLQRFGLLEAVGDAKNRELQLTKLALDILVLDEDDTKRWEAIRRAALKPAIHSRMWKEWGANSPSDSKIQHYLITQEGFKPPAASDLVKKYKKTILFAKLGECDIIDSGNQDEVHDISVGDFVQWISQGVMQFKGPRRVTGLSDDGEWAFVKGSETGVLVSELKIEKKPYKPAVPPANPGYMPPDHGTREFPLYLSGGRRALLRIPEQMTAADFDLLKTQINSSLSVTEATTTFVDAHSSSCLGESDGATE